MSRSKNEPLDVRSLSTVPLHAPKKGGIGQLNKEVIYERVG